MKTWAIVGYSGGKCLNKAHQCIHFKVDDMQIAEDPIDRGSFMYAVAT